MTGSDVVVDYDPSWPDRFEDIRAFLAPAVADVAQAIEHVGSTSVPGLAAQPVIDVDVVVQSRTDIPAAVAALEELGYGHVGDLGRADREAFRSVSWLPRHHLYVVVHGKRDVAHLYEIDPDAYVEAKSDVVTDILRRARHPAGSPGERQ